MVWKEYLRGTGLKNARQDSIDRCAGRCYITEITLKKGVTDHIHQSIYPSKSRNFQASALKTHHKYSETCHSTYNYFPSCSNQQTSFLRPSVFLVFNRS